MNAKETALVALGRSLAQTGYRFSTVTPTTHRLINSRQGSEVARSLRDVFGWSRPFNPRDVPEGLFTLMCDGSACERIQGTSLWRSTVRFASLDGSLYVHSAFPTDGPDAVFFGPDTYRFVHALARHAVRATRVIDVGCGSGAGGVTLGRRSSDGTAVVLADVSEQALSFAAVNAELAGVSVELVQSDVLGSVEGEFDLVIANPPYLLDEAERLYCAGGGQYGEQLGARIVREGIERLSTMQNGGSVLLYTGAAIVEGNDMLLRAIEGDLAKPGVRHLYEELDPDVFGEELERPAYSSVERIAAVLLRVQVRGAD